MDKDARWWAEIDGVDSSGQSWTADGTAEEEWVGRNPV
jgi:hypothetical protein